MRIVNKILNRVLLLGGEQHSGWLPAAASSPQPVSTREATVDLELVEEAPGNILLICKSHNTNDNSDNWFDSIEEAKSAAKEWYGIDESEWE